MDTNRPIRAGWRMAKERPITAAVLVFLLWQLLWFVLKELVFDALAGAVNAKLVEFFGPLLPRAGEFVTANFLAGTTAILALLLTYCIGYWVGQRDPVPAGTPNFASKRAKEQQNVTDAHTMLAVSREIEKALEKAPTHFRYSSDEKQFIDRSIDKSLRIRLREACESAGRHGNPSPDLWAYNSDSVTVLREAADELRMTARNVLRESGVNPELHDPTRGGGLDVAR